MIDEEAGKVHQTLPAIFYSTALPKKPLNKTTAFE
jgi:hypothetical protein